jgi:hypothetical protein
MERRPGGPRRIDVRNLPILPRLYSILRIRLVQLHHFLHGTDRSIQSSMDLGLFGNISFLSYRARVCSLAGKPEEPVQVRSSPGWGQSVVKVLEPVGARLNRWVQQARMR